MSIDIEGALDATQRPDARRTRVAHPKGYEPGVTFSVETGLPSEAVVSSDRQLFESQDHRRLIEEQTKLTIPAHLDVRLERLTLENNGDSVATRWWYKYKFVPRTAPADTAEVTDHQAFLKGLRRNRSKVTPKHTGTNTFGLSWNDWQTGKQEGGGTPALLSRFDQQIEATKARVRELNRIGRNVGDALIVGGGDILEGCTIFPHQMMHIDADRRRQVNVATDMILYGLDELAPLFERVRVLVVGGNHGENRVDGNRVNRTDNDDCLVFENAARVTARDPRLEHVSFVIAQGEPAKTLDVNGWVYATTHGQAFGKGAGTPERKAFNWYKGQAGGHLPAGDAHVLVSHHYHHHAVRDWGACLWVQTPANDGGSLQHTDLTGEAADAGMLSWVVTPEQRFTDPAIL